MTGQHPYYADKLSWLADLFGEVTLGPNWLDVSDQRFSIVDDVIVLLPADRCPPGVRAELQRRESSTAMTSPSETKFSEKSSRDSARKWQEYTKILPEHAQEFLSYFDVVDLATLKDQRVCDLGCGNGRWSHSWRRTVAS